MVDVIDDFVRWTAGDEAVKELAISSIAFFVFLYSDPNVAVAVSIPMWILLIFFLLN